MPLEDLIRAGAERVAAGVSGQKAWRADSTGRWQRQPLTAGDRRVISDRVERRLGRPMTGSERGQLTRIIDAADTATRRAHEIGREGRRPLRPSEVPAMPGRGETGTGQYVYTTAVTTIDPATGQTRTFTLVVTSTGIIGANQVRAAAAAAIASGDVVQRSGSGPPELGGVRVVGIDVISVYRDGISR